jgi:hypothetical protein
MHDPRGVEELVRKLNEASKKSRLEAMVKIQQSEQFVIPEFVYSDGILIDPEHNHNDYDDVVVHGYGHYDVFDNWRHFGDEW